MSKIWVAVVVEDTIEVLKLLILSSFTVYVVWYRSEGILYTVGRKAEDESSRFEGGLLAQCRFVCRVLEGFHNGKSKRSKQTGIDPNRYTAGFGRVLWDY